MINRSGNKPHFGQKILQRSESRTKRFPKQEDASNPANLLTMMVETISRITKDNNDLSSTSTTLLEKIYTCEDSLYPFFLCGGSLGKQINDALLPNTKKSGSFEDNSASCWERREEIEDPCESDDDLSISSDVVPLSMMDDDALDEISFTRELMGYEEGFYDYYMPIGVNGEDQHEELFSRTKESYSQRIHNSPIQNFVKSSTTETRPPRPGRRGPTRRRPHNLIKLKNSISPSCREGPASFSKDDSCCSTSKLSASSFNLRKKSNTRKSSGGSSHGSTEETSWWKFHRRSRSIEGSTCSKESKCNNCRKSWSECRCNDKVEI